MQLLVNGQPQEGVIGGVPDLAVAVSNVNRNFTSVYKESIANMLSPEQGAAHDPSIVSLSETLTPDRPATSVFQSVPWFPILAGIVVLYFIVRK